VACLACICSFLQCCKSNIFERSQLYRMLCLQVFNQSIPHMHILLVTGVSALLSAALVSSKGIYSTPEAKGAATRLDKYMCTVPVVVHVHTDTARHCKPHGSRGP
jgi:hypothetical protein